MVGKSEVQPIGNTLMPCVSSFKRCVIDETCQQLKSAESLENPKLCHISSVTRLDVIFLAYLMLTALLC